ncbi:hypothetical protein N9164_06010 [Draconibacterium sp.]|nr:hypothetical protein [Draconibacterium sp.]
METTNENQIVITTASNTHRQRLPLHLMISLAAGSVAGVMIIFGLIWAAKMLTGL